jgi:glycosyltransferase involved in cell wall biosynthesis
MANRLKSELGIDRVDCIRLSQGQVVSTDRERDARCRVRARYNIPDDAVTYACFGGLTPDKRIPQILDAFRAIRGYVPNARLMFGGTVPDHYDLNDDVRARGFERDVVITGYLQTDDELTDCIAAVDVTLNLRWPTARELSGPWLRALAAGKPSIILDVLQLVDVPSLDPRTWAINVPDCEPVAVAVDILDEDHSLRLAMKRLGEDAELRRTLGAAAQSYWLREHSPKAMLADYLRVMSAARSLPVPSAALPDHLVDNGARLLERLMAPLGVAVPFG